MSIVLSLIPVVALFCEKVLGTTIFFVEKCRETIGVTERPSQDLGQSY